MGGEQRNRLTYQKKKKAKQQSFPPQKSSEVLQEHISFIDVFITAGMEQLFLKHLSIIRT